MNMPEKEAAYNAAFFTRQAIDCLISARTFADQIVSKGVPTYTDYDLMIRNLEDIKVKLTQFMRSCDEKKQSC